VGPWLARHRDVFGGFDLPERARGFWLVLAGIDVERPRRVDDAPLPIFRIRPHVLGLGERSDEENSIGALAGRQQEIDRRALLVAFFERITAVAELAGEDAPGDLAGGCATH